jgi:Zinc knuckle
VSAQTHSVTFDELTARLLEEELKVDAMETPIAMMSKRTGGACYRCGQAGHLKRDCPGKCGHCNKAGHDESQCWIKHQELRPERDGNRRYDAKYAMTALSSKIAM